MKYWGGGGASARGLVKPVFHWRIFSREATFFFCLNLISSTWFQPKAQGQREKAASRENIR